MRRSIRDIRRAELTDAVIAAIHEHGFSSLTVNEIAGYAETSTGSIHYYFGSKEALLEAAMRHLLTILRTATIERLKGCNGPEERLRAIVLANFDDRFFSRRHCSVWSQYWCYAPYVPVLARLQRLNRKRVQSNLKHELKHVLPDDQLDSVCLSIQSYMDGIWINAAQADANVDAKAAQKDALDFLMMLIRDRH